jgi:hypothetical protein
MEHKEQETQYHSQPIINAKQLIDALKNVPQDKKIIFCVQDGSDVVWVTNDPHLPFVRVMG